MRLVWPLVVASTLAVGCQRARAHDTDPGATTSSSAASPANGGPTARAAGPSTSPSASPDAASSPVERCAEARQAALLEPALPGAEAYERERLHFARVRGRSLLWKRVPGALSPALAEALTRRSKSASVVDVVRGLERRLESPAARREVFLREGYLFADDVELALALVEQLQLVELFDEPTLVLERGTERHELVRAAKTRWLPERYLYKGGENAGMPAELLLGDRIAPRADELDRAAPLVVDLRALADAASFDRIRPMHLTERNLVAELRYGPDTWVPALIDVTGAKASVACEAPSPDAGEKRRRFVAEHSRLDAAMAHIRAVVRAMAKEELPFDAAPEQTNGVLRRDWRRAYLQGKTQFSSSGRDYPVYTEDGRPRPPQVCIDFLTDVWERASGTWYQPAEVESLDGKRPQLTPRPKLLEGGIRFDRTRIKNRRSVVQFERFTRKNVELFEVWEVPKSDRVKFEDRAAFFRSLGASADRFRVGDMLIVHGYKEGGRPHYHSLIVTETCPVTGAISLVASNAVKPREQTLEGIMHLSPRRTLRSRIRVREPWLNLIAKTPNTAR
jgi:hypothetical protein